MFNVICIDEEKLNIFYEVKGVSILEMDEGKTSWSESELTLVLQ